MRVIIWKVSRQEKLILNIKPMQCHDAVVMGQTYHWLSLDLKHSSQINPVLNDRHPYKLYNRVWVFYYIY